MAQWTQTSLFLSAQSQILHASAFLVGLPYDGGSSYRQGSAYAPNMIRELSASLETYSPFQDKDLKDIILCDCGNIEFNSISLDGEIGQAFELIQLLFRDGSFGIFIGGDHSVSLIPLRAALATYPDLHFLVLDAHTDLRESYQGSRFSHACVIKRALEILGAENITLVGTRSGTKEDFILAKSLGILTLSVDDAIERLESKTMGKAVYLSIDIDVFDPSIAPGTGTPEPGGLLLLDLFKLLKGLESHKIVAADVVEISPPHDPSSVTGILGAYLIRELILKFAG